MARRTSWTQREPQQATEKAGKCNRRVIRFSNIPPSAQPGTIDSQAPTRSSRAAERHRYRAEQLKRLAA